MSYGFSEMGFGSDPRRGDVPLYPDGTPPPSTDCISRGIPTSRWAKCSSDDCAGGTRILRKNPARSAARKKIITTTVRCIVSSDGKKQNGSVGGIIADV
jgi:hypothetical protein